MVFTSGCNLELHNLKFFKEKKRQGKVFSSEAIYMWAREAPEDVPCYVSLARSGSHIDTQINNG